MDNENDLTLKKMADGADEVFFIFNVQQQEFEYINKAFESITKRKVAEVLKNPELLLTIIHQDDLDYVKLNFKHFLEVPGTNLISFRIIRNDQVERWIRLKLYSLANDSQVFFLTGVAEDDTARKVSVLNMQTVNGWKNSTLEILSHDLRGPIGTVKMLAHVIAMKLPDNPEIHKLTELIEDISKRNIHLIKTVLKRETLETASVEMTKERLDIVGEIRQVMDIYIKSQESIEKKIELTSSHEEIFVMIDSMKFLQVINNLVSNAIKFTRPNGHVHLHIEKLEETILITVTDNGIGIPRKLYPVLFDKYTAAGRKGVQGEDSVGLGMWIIKSITESHGGKVWFESEVDKGTKFYLEVPIGTMEP
jgi:two-component system sensor histidine kinase VicK